MHALHPRPAPAHHLERLVHWARGRWNRWDALALLVVAAGTLLLVARNPGVGIFLLFAPVPFVIGLLGRTLRAMLLAVLVSVLFQLVTAPAGSYSPLAAEDVIWAAVLCLMTAGSAAVEAWFGICVGRAVHRIKRD